jgi:hypothetical protein
MEDAKEDKKTETDRNASKDDCFDSSKRLA